MKKNAFVRFGQALLVLGTMAIGFNASAAGVPSAQCTVSNVFRDFNGPSFTCSGSGFVLRSTCGGTTVGADAVKSWESMAIAALLSGKKLNILFDNGSLPCVYNMSINQ